MLHINYTSTMSKLPAIIEGADAAEESWLVSINEFLKTSSSDKATLRDVGRHLDGIHSHNCEGNKNAPSLPALTILGAIRRDYGGLRSFCKRYKSKNMQFNLVSIANCGDNSDRSLPHQQSKKSNNYYRRRPQFCLQLLDGEMSSVATDRTMEELTSATEFDMDDNLLRMSITSSISTLLDDHAGGVKHAEQQQQQQLAGESCKMEACDDRDHVVTSQGNPSCETHSQVVYPLGAKDGTCSDARQFLSSSAEETDETKTSTSNICLETADGLQTTSAESSIQQHEGVDLAVTMNLRILIGECIYHSGGVVSGASVGTMLKKSEGVLDSDSSALDELKESYKSLSYFLKLDADIFTVNATHRGFTVGFEETTQF